MVYRGPTWVSWELVSRTKPKENPRQPPLPAHAHTEPLPWGCGPPFFLEVSFLYISPVFFFCKQLYYLCAHAWRHGELWGVFFFLHCGTWDWTRLFRLAIFPAEPSHQPHFHAFFKKTCLTSADIFILNFWPRIIYIINNVPLFPFPFDVCWGW